MYTKAHQIFKYMEMLDYYTRNDTWSLWDTSKWDRILSVSYFIHPFLLTLRN